MAIRDIKDAKVNNGFRFSIVKAVITGIFVMLVFTGVMQIAKSAVEYFDYEEKIAAVNTDIAEIEADNTEKGLILIDEKKQEEYFERKLREDFGYCKSGEKVFYISSYSE